MAPHATRRTGGPDAEIPGYVRLLWRVVDRDIRPGPRRSLDAHEIAAAGVRLADTGGLDAVSMRSVAAALNLSSMALYRYLTSKRELLLAVVDEALGPPPDRPDETGDWRAQVSSWAQANRQGLSRHRWIVSVPVGEPPLLPNSVAWLEAGLAAFAETALTEQQKLSAILLVDVYVRGQVVLATGFDAGDGPPDAAAAGRLYTQRLLTLADPGRFPHLHRTLTAGALADDTDFTTDEFEFGLHTLLDGVEALINRRSSPGRSVTP